MYYRQKGSRPPTRPEAIHETFELCADVIVAKLQSYYHQADEYHNQCLQGIVEYLLGMENTTHLFESVLQIQSMSIII